MNLQWFYVIFALLMNANALSKEAIQAFLQVSALEYEDACYETAYNQMKFLGFPNNYILQTWVNASIDYGLHKCDGKAQLQKEFNNIELDEKLQYQYDLMSKLGDAMLSCSGKNEWEVLVNFIADIEYLKLTKNYSMTSEGNVLFREDADKLLSRDGTTTDKLATWSAWHKMLLPFTDRFSTNIQFIKQAAILNGVPDVTKYWEMLTEYEDGYRKTTEQWGEISLLYDKIVIFLKTRIEKKYGDSFNSDEFPAHLLGSLEGYDWTLLALDVIPQKNIVYGIQKKILDEKYVGQNLYILSTRLPNAILNHLPEPDFFENSNFHQQCPSKLLNRCNKDTPLVATCSYPSITNYLSAHKDIAKVIFHQMSKNNKNNPILNFANRYSVLEETVSELFGILSTRPFWMNSLNLMNLTYNEENCDMVSLMITALNVLPRLAYYYTADKWRIDLIKNNTFKPNDLIDSWWQYRSQYEGITTDSTKLPTFLDDSIITSNEPYLPKFIGTILAFQIFDHLLDVSPDGLDKVENWKNKNLIKMMQYGDRGNWYNTVKKYFQFYDLRVDPLLSYFAPLEDFIDRYTDEDYDTTDDIGENLQKMQDEFMINFNTSTSIATTIESTTVTVLKFEKPKNSSVKSDLNSGIQSDATVASPKTISTDVDGKNNSIDNENFIKGTSKAVWAISAALIAIIAIVLIAIFGRQRCRKTPKSRRYV